MKKWKRFQFFVTKWETNIAQKLMILVDKVYQKLVNSIKTLIEILLQL